MLTSDCRSCKLTDDFTFKTGYPTAFPMSQIFSNSVSRFIVNYIFVLFLKTLEKLLFFFLIASRASEIIVLHFPPFQILERRKKSFTF